MRSWTRRCWRDSWLVVHCCALAVLVRLPCAGSTKLGSLLLVTLFRPEGTALSRTSISGFLARWSHTASGALASVNAVFEEEPGKFGPCMTQILVAAE